tara:strand:+ start:2720 stop:3151 length:432 start_codon:yes stop_codon:yes gene_type:complete
MKKTILVFLAAMLLALTSVGTLADDGIETLPPTDDNSAIQPAPQPEDYIQKLPMMIDCGPGQAIVDVINRHGEIPFANFEIFIQIPGGQILRQPGTMFVNTSTGSWSLLAWFPESETACIVQNGITMTPAGRTSAILTNYLTS